MIGSPDLAAHDLRRSYAQVGYDSGIPITQLGKLSGNSDVAMTQRYLMLDLDRERRQAISYRLDGNGKSIAGLEVKVYNGE